MQLYTQPDVQCLAVLNVHKRPILPRTRGNSTPMALLPQVGRPDTNSAGMTGTEFVKSLAPLERPLLDAPVLPNHRLQHRI